MEIKIRAADLDTDRERLIKTVCRFLNPQADGRRFDWLYRNNRYGQARAWLALEGNSGHVIGAAAAFSRRFIFRGKELNAWVLGDFCLDPQFRSLGPALQLQRACLTVLEANQDGTFCYDFPSRSMVAVYKRLGIGVNGQMLRMAKPLRVDRRVKEIVRNRAAQGVVASVGNTILKIASRRVLADEHLELSLQQAACGQEFTKLAEEQSTKFIFCLKRSAAYLNWRYENNPEGHHAIITARRDGRLVGYIVWTQKEEDAWIVDLFGEEDPRMMRSLVAEIIALSQKSGAMTLSVSMNEAQPWRWLFSETGFHLRDSFPVVVIPSKTFPHKINPRLSGWYLMQADRDS